MNDKTTLLILAAGMGSRYGGLKQIDPVGPNGEIIIEYSMADALKAGFTKIVFIIRHFFEDAFREKIGKKLDGRVEVAYAFQELESCLNGFPLPSDRQKPWGTGHAILVAENLIHEPFAVINADDYYGPNAFKILHTQLRQMALSPESDYAMVGYTLRNTLSEYGTVSRGVCQCDASMRLAQITECTKIRRQGTAAVFIDEQGNEKLLSGDEVVSMNFWGFCPDLFGHLKHQFREFLTRHAAEPKSEFYIPTAVDTLIQNGQKKVNVLKTNDGWFGVTYPEDKVIARTAIQKLIDNGVYPQRLWTQA
jgi:dTDP-glucose pyrophosphorylase